ncbi:hypothetical protein DERP_014098 [Dermatophagoides pteronyssinus]|uniref:Uncharacterized protein n=1 Tax=Dermatophagoides pteronyssinus TaxID=6956 RepID=A0ABQ8J6Z5_DERPT|nr:hypothetical protein DERP_014098 [Dermatophagoides pteronyssinus]
MIGGAENCLGLSYSGIYQGLPEHSYHFFVGTGIDIIGIGTGNNTVVSLLDEFEPRFCIKPLASRVDSASTAIDLCIDVGSLTLSTIELISVPIFLRSLNISDNVLVPNALRNVTDVNNCVACP